MIWLNQKCGWKCPDLVLKICRPFILATSLVKPWLWNSNILQNIYQRKYMDSQTVDIELREWPLSCKESLKSAKSNAWKCKMSITTITQTYNHGDKKRTARQRQRQRQKGRQRAFSFTKEFSWMNFSHRWPLPLNHVWGILWTLWLSVCYLRSRTQDNKIVRVPLKQQ